MNIQIVGAHVALGQTPEEVHAYLAYMRKKHQEEPSISCLVVVSIESLKVSRPARIFAQTMIQIAGSEQIVGLEEIKKLFSEPLEVDAFSDADNFLREVNTMIRLLEQKEHDDLKGTAKFKVVLE